MKETVKTVTKKLLRTTKYPAPVRKLLSNAPVDIDLDFAESANIGRGSYFHGNVSLADGVEVAGDCLVTGTVMIEANARLGHSCKIVGDARVGEHTNLVGENEVVGNVDIGKCCAIAPRVVFHETNHEIHKPGIQRRFYAEVLGTELRRVSEGPIQVGNDVWLGKDAIVLSGVEIGDGAIVGAGSVVTDDVEPYSIVAGTPAEHRKWRFPEHVRKQLLEVEWWHWSDNRKRRNREFFSTDLSDVEDVTDLVVE